MANYGRKASRISETASRIASKARFRWVIFILCHLAYFCIASISTAITITIVAMIHDEENLDPTGSNSTLTESTVKHIHVTWDGKQKDRMLQAFSWGSMATSILGGRCGEIFGPRWAISLALLSGGLLYLIFPTVAVKSFWGAYIIRVIQGISYGIVVPTIGVVVSRWSPRYESTLSNTVANTGMISANILVHPIAGLLVSGDFLGGWPAVYYLFGGLTVFMTIPWYLFVYDDPESHPRLSPGELDEIVETRALKTGVSKKVPWLKILISLPVLAYLTVQFTYGWLLALVSTQIPSFYEEVLGMNFETNGFMTALPWIVAFVIGNTTSAVADRIRRTNRFSQTSLRKTFTFVALGSATVAIFMVTLVGKNSIAAVAMVTLSKGMGTFTAAGSGVSHLDIAPTFAGTLNGMGATMLSLAALAMNEAVARMIGNEATRDKWYQFFYLTSAVNAIGVIVYCLLASGKIQKWDPSWQPEKPFEKKRDSKVSNISSPKRLSSFPGNIKIDDLERKY